MQETNISDAHRDAFQALRDPQFSNFALFSCFVNGEPAAAIACVTRDGEDHDITPLFVSLTRGMALTDHDGRSAGGSEETPPPDGWCLIETDSGRIALQCDDEAGRFNTDEDALDYVTRTPPAARACIQQLLAMRNDD